MTILFLHCDENLRMLLFFFFFPARVLSMADGLRFNSLGQSLHNVIKIIIMQVSLRAQLFRFRLCAKSFMRYNRPHIYHLAIDRCEWRDEFRRGKVFFGREEKTHDFVIMQRKPNSTINFESDDKLNYVCEASNLCAYNFCFYFFPVFGPK